MLRLPTGRLPLLAVAVALGGLCFPRAGQAQQTVATARHLEAVASDGSRVHVGEVTGTFQLGVASRPMGRFGKILVRAGLDFEARATLDSAIPAFLTGDLGGVLRVADDVRDARVDALHRRGRALRARIVLGDTTLASVPVQRGAVRVEGSAPVASSIAWSVGSSAVRAGVTGICAEPARRCTAMRNAQPLAVEVRAQARGWSHVLAEAPGLRLEGWVTTGAVVPNDGLGAWGAGLDGAISDGCPYQGRPALVAAGTRVHVRPAGPVWARVPDEPDSVWVHDTRPDSSWVELTFARGVQRSFPGTTCTTGWVPRASVSWDVLREGALEMARETRGGRAGVVLRAVPPWLADAGLQVGDFVVARMVRGGAQGTTDLDGVRANLGVGGLFRLVRDGQVRELRIPLAPGCEEPGAGQPVTCRPR